MRIIVTSAGRRWFYVLAGLALMLTSVAFVRFNVQTNRYSEIYLIEQLRKLEDVDGLRNEVEEVRRPNVPGGYEPDIRTGYFSKLFLKNNIEYCPATKPNSVKPDFDVSEMSSSLRFDDLDWDGDVGVWDAEFEKKYQEDQKLHNGSAAKNGMPLKVFIVPFSHSDPGWLMTVDEYFKTYTNNTLNLMVENLQNRSDMTFVWAETSFFKIWWDELDEKRRGIVKSFIKNNRLEILNGGYVMPDEANCHYYAIVHQYIYGHQWLLKNVDFTPKHGFSIDPFGYSSTMPYILKNLGFDSLYIQRIHYIVRKKLMEAQASQFNWIQPWDSENSDAMFSYMSHATLYDVKHTCGVNTNICINYDIQFEEERIIEKAAEDLLSQFKKTVFMYPHNAMLFPLGMDFRWNNQYEWDAKYKLFKSVMEYLNKNKAKDVQVQFGTYKDYYDEVFKRMGTPDKWKNLPNIAGDFFPYADKTEEYWTGYFTSHPFQKSLDRDLENHLRVAELLYVIAHLKSYKLDAASLFPSFEAAAKALGLFQHHDAITGTSKLAVMDDYEKRLFFGLEDMYAVIQHITTSIFWPDDIHHESLSIYNRRSGHSSSLSSREILSLTRNGRQISRRLVLFNSLASSRTSAVDLFVNSENLIVEDSNGDPVKYQTSACFDSKTQEAEILANCTRVTFLIEFTSVQFRTFIIRPVSSIKAEQSGRTISKMRNNTMSDWRIDIPIVLANNKLTAKFSPTSGLLESMAEDGFPERSVRLEWKRYETRRSGAYLFWPNGVADLAPYPHEIVLIEGPLFSEIRVKITTDDPILTSVARIFHSKADLDNSLHLESTHNLIGLSNVELVMRFTTDLKNNFTFFTDSNGFQMVRRKASQSLPMQANYFPATSMAFLQDQHSRFTIHMTQAHGVGHMDVGQLEIMIDRTLNQDDSRGVEEALKDIKSVRTTTRIQLENRGFCRSCKNSDPTSDANAVNLELNYPVVVFTSWLVENETISGKVEKNLLPPLPCENHLVMMKPVNYEVGSPIGVILHRFGAENCSEKGHKKNCAQSDQLSVPDFTGLQKLVGYNLTTLNFVENSKMQVGTDMLALKAKKLVAFKINL